MEQLFRIGVVASTHGLRGEVKVYPTTDDAKRFLDLKYVQIGDGADAKKAQIESVRFFKQMVILKLKGVDDIDQARVYCKKELYVTREQAAPLKENEYFIADLIGLRAKTEQGEELGELVDVLQTGANDVYVIRQKDAQDLLVPAIKDCVKQIDLKAGTIELRLLKGLREINRK